MSAIYRVAKVAAGLNYSFSKNGQAKAQVHWLKWCAICANAEIAAAVLKGLREQFVNCELDGTLLTIEIYGMLTKAEIDKRARAKRSQTRARWGG